MFEFVTNHIPCLIAFLANPGYAGLSLFSLLGALFLLGAFKKEQRSLGRKVMSAYAFLFFLSLPLMLFLYTMVCASAPKLCGPEDMGWLGAAGIILPGTLAVSLAAGIVAIPLLFVFSSKSRRLRGRETQWLETQAGRFGMRPPRLYLVDNSKPQAFSFSSLFSAVFVSVGAMELLSRKEREAVLLHELGHLKSRSSSLKFSALVLKLATPLAANAFHQTLSAEEEKADAFAAKVQGTRKFLESARKKVEAFA